MTPFESGERFLARIDAVKDIVPKDGRRLLVVEFSVLTSSLEASLMAPVRNAQRYSTFSIGWPGSIGLAAQVAFQQFYRVASRLSIGPLPNSLLTNVEILGSFVELSTSEKTRKDGSSVTRSRWATPTREVFNTVSRLAGDLWQDVLDGVTGAKEVLSDVVNEWLENSSIDVERAREHRLAAKCFDWSRLLRAGALDKNIASELQLQWRWRRGRDLDLDD